LLQTSFHLGMLAGSRTSTPASHSGQLLTPMLFTPCAQVGWVQPAHGEPARDKNYELFLTKYGIIRLGLSSPSQGLLSNCPNCTERILKHTYFSLT
jgi:hypothetical protein